VEKEGDQTASRWLCRERGIVESEWNRQRALIQSRSLCGRIKPLQPYGMRQQPFQGRAFEGSVGDSSDVRKIKLDGNAQVGRSRFQGGLMEGIP
jgi:hypothetical protein